MRLTFNATTIKRGLLLLWALWFSIALCTNITDGLKALKLLPDTWSFASGNFLFIRTVTDIYTLPEWLVGIFFLVVLLWEGLATFLFWRAFMGFKGKDPELGLIYPAFTVSLALWAAFMIADEICIAYKIEEVHRALFGLQLLTLLAVRLLPDSEPGSSPSPSP